MPVHYPWSDDHDGIRCDGVPCQFVRRDRLTVGRNGRVQPQRLFDDRPRLYQPWQGAFHIVAVGKLAIRLGLEAFTPLRRAR